MLTLWPMCFWLGFSLVPFLCAIPVEHAYPAHGTAALLRLQGPARFSPWLSHFPGMLPGGEVLRANNEEKNVHAVECSPTCLPPMALFWGAPVCCHSPPAVFWGAPLQGLAVVDGEGYVNPVSSPRYVYLTKFNSPAGFIHPKPTCSLVAELWVWLLLQRFLAASGWWFCCSLPFSGRCWLFRGPRQASSPRL